MSRRAGFAGSARERWRRDPSRVESDSEEGEEDTTTSPTTPAMGPYPFSTYSLDNEFPAATRRLALNECAREFRQYYEALQAQHSPRIFAHVVRVHATPPQACALPRVQRPLREGWEYISDGCRLTHVLENAVPWVLTVFLLRFGFQSHSGTEGSFDPHVVWYRDYDPPHDGIVRGAPSNPLNTPQMPLTRKYPVSFREIRCPLWSSPCPSSDSRRGTRCNARFRAE